MRRHEEWIEVRVGRIGQGIAGIDPQSLEAWPHGPAQFVWRERLWRVLGVHGCWVESEPWWDQPAVRAIHGEPRRTSKDGFGPATPVAADPAEHHEQLSGSSFEHPHDQARQQDDLVREQEVWRVEAADGREGSRGVYDLTHSLADDRWRLRAVLD